MREDPKEDDGSGAKRKGGVAWRSPSLGKHRKQSPGSERESKVGPDGEGAGAGIQSPIKRLTELLFFSCTWKMIVE